MRQSSGSGKHPPMLQCISFIKNKIFSYSMDETWEDVLKDLLEDWKYKAFKCKKNKIISLPTYPPADSVGWQCQTNNILSVASQWNDMSTCGLESVS